jgi:hypothetical protein
LAADPGARPAFYALRPGGWRDLVTVLHPPYTLWHVSNVAIGAAAASQIHAGRLAAAIAAFFLAVGIGAHALDELNGRPLGTQLSDRTLIALAAGGLGGALAIGLAGTIFVSPTLLPLVIFGGFIAPAYNLELFGGRFHTDFWLAAWGGFSALTGWWVNALGLHSVREAIAASAAVLACFFLTLVQRRLSTPVRQLRRRTVSVEGTQVMTDGSVRELRREDITKPLDGALLGLSIAVPLLAVAAVALLPFALRGVLGASSLVVVFGAGAAFALSAFCLKLIADALDRGAWGALVLVLAVAAAGALAGTVTEQTALQRRQATQVAPIIFVVEMLVPIALALTVVGESWGGSTAAIAIALALVVGGVVALSRTPQVAGLLGS